MFLLTPVCSVPIQVGKQPCISMGGKIDVDTSTKNVSDLCPKILSVYDLLAVTMLNV